MTVTYTAIIDGKAITVVSLTGRTRESMEQYCRDKFGHKFERLL